MRGVGGRDGGRVQRCGVGAPPPRSAAARGRMQVGVLLGALPGAPH